VLAEIVGPDLIWVLVVIVVVLFGGAAIPRWARGLGSATGKVEKGLRDLGVDEKPPPPTSRRPPQ
jgi:Sec-independent protein translocase protein TatA